MESLARVTPSGAGCWTEGGWDRESLEVDSFVLIGKRREAEMSRAGAFAPVQDFLAKSSERN